MIGTATLSDDRVYRYSLERRWARGATVSFIGLNPSTADEQADDATIRRCVRFARDWGYAHLVMLNLFALRATQPNVLWEGPRHPVGPENDETILRYVRASEVTVLCWGATEAPVKRETFGRPLFPVYQRACEVATLLRAEGCAVHCLGTTQHRHPRHPVRLRADTQLVEFPLVRYPRV